MERGSKEVKTVEEAILVQVEFARADGPMGFPVFLGK